MDEMIEKALKRPRNHFELTERERWKIDRDLGLLDWEGPKTYEDAKVLQKHHGLV